MESNDLVKDLSFFIKCVLMEGRCSLSTLNNTQYINNETFKGEKQSTAVALANTTGP